MCAGYAIYGPTTMLVLSFGRGVHGFTLDREIGEFMLTHPDMRIPDEASEFAINASNSRFWEPAVTRYVDECLAGSSGPRGRDFNMRWVASLVAEAHRILLRGGVFLYPRDDRASARNGKLRLLYEANPIGFLIEQAGGRASSGDGPILEVQPESIHQRTGFIFGSRPRSSGSSRITVTTTNDATTPRCSVRGGCSATRAREARRVETPPDRRGDRLVRAPARPRSPGHSNRSFGAKA